MQCRTSSVAVLAFTHSADGEPDHYMLRLQEVTGRAQGFEFDSVLKDQHG